MNFLDSGGVLPFGLLQCDPASISRGFNKTYKNTALRMGIVMKVYTVNDQKNITKLTTEYDVIVSEQDEAGGASPVTYRNCISLDGVGSIADFFEKTFRPQTKDSVTGNTANTKDQDGAIVLLLCLDGMSEKAVIIGGLNHPNRKTTLSDKPHLEGEYNGNHLVINEDGSASYTFKGATDSYGKPTDSSQGNTEFDVEKDGSFQVKHDGITQRLDKSGVASLTAKDNISNTTQKSFNVTATEDVNVSATKKFNLTAQDMAASISGTAAFQCQTGTLTSSGSYGIKASQLTLEAEGLAKIKAPSIVLDGLVSLGGQGGLPVLTLGTIIYGTGNIGLPVISRAISGFATKVTAK